MIHNYAKFINGEIFTQKDVLRILDDNKIEGKIINIKFYQYKKIYIQVKKNKKKYFFKLCLNKHSIDLSKNESDGYDYFSKIDKPEFNLPNYKLINITQNYSLSKIEFIEGSRGNYFELSKFYNISKNIFVGKSLITSLVNDGGQNPIEPAKFGCKIFHGPNISNFAEIYEYLHTLGITKEINNIDELDPLLVERFGEEKTESAEIATKIQKYGQNILNDLVMELKKYI